MRIALTMVDPAADVRQAFTIAVATPGITPPISHPAE
jgi:hypothetical protein